MKGKKVYVTPTVHIVSVKSENILFIGSVWDQSGDGHVDTIWGDTSPDTEDDEVAARRFWGNSPVDDWD